MILGIDIGATKTLICLFSDHGHILDRIKFPTSHSSSVFLEDLESNLTRFISKKINFIVMSVPGIVQKNYTFIFGNLPWPSDIPLSPLLKKIFTCDHIILNDSDLATLYESSYYSGKSIYLTFSTGVGGGIAKNGILLPSSKNFEPGHKKYPFRHHSLLEWEDIASSNAIKRDYHTQVTDIKRSPAFYDDVAARLSLGLIDIIKTYHPDVIIIGGAVGFLMPELLRPLKKLLKSEFSSLPKIKRAKKPLESVIHGEYLYAKSLK